MAVVPARSASGIDTRLTPFDDRSTTHRCHHADVAGHRRHPEGLPHSVVMNQRYYHAVATAGAAPVLIPLIDEVETLRAIYDRLDGILIPGGVDVDPAVFGEKPHERLGRIDPARDRVEIQLVEWAVEDGKPVLGLCRGLQVINVALGGTLYQDLDAEYPNAIKHDYFPTYGFSRDHLAHDDRGGRGVATAARAGGRIRPGEQHASPGDQGAGELPRRVGHGARRPDRGDRVA